MPNITPITPPRVPLIDPRTGLIDRAWYLFFLSLNNSAQAADSNPDVGPSPESLIATYDAALQTLAQDVGTQLLVNNLVSQVAEMQKQIDALQIVPQQVVQLLSQLADVSAASPSNGDKLIYNSTTAKWEQDSRSYLMLE